MEVVVNGRVKDLTAGTTLAVMLEDLGLDRRFLVVEYNGEPLSRTGIDRVTLSDGDRLELVRPVAGG